MKKLLAILAISFSFTMVNAQTVKSSTNAQSVTQKKSCDKGAKKSCDKGTKKSCSKTAEAKSCSKTAAKKSCSSTKTTGKACCASKAPAYNKLVSPKDFKSYMDRFPAENVVDIRTKKEIAQNGMIEGAKNIDFNASYFKEEMLKLDKNVAIMIYCRSGGRSGKAVEMLKSWGFKKIYDMQGGYNAYLRAFPKG